MCRALLSILTSAHCALENGRTDLKMSLQIGLKTTYLSYLHLLFSTGMLTLRKSKQSETQALFPVAEVQF